MQELGLVHLYTGTGKGKTTCAVGLAIRALSQGLKVCYTNFNKNAEKYGINETLLLEKLGAKILSLTQEHPSFNKSLSVSKHSAETLSGFETIVNKVSCKAYDLLIMDELLISVRDGFIEEQKVVDFIKYKPKNLELVLTGRGATENLIQLADYVSEISAVKHPMEQGILGRKGIEY